MYQEIRKMIAIGSVFVLAITLSGCGQGMLFIQGEYGSVEVHKTKDRPNRERGRSFKKIPPGHMPPPGSCRIWLPNTPPGKQPPPGDCYELSRMVPPGAWLVEG